MYEPYAEQPVYANQMNYAPTPTMQEETVSVNPYALEPPAYEQSENKALKQKEDELFQKERFLMESQQELYEREKKLADREAEFINRSKALDYKEKHIMEGRSYTPATAPQPVYVPTPKPVPVPVVQPQVFVAEETEAYTSQSEPSFYEPADTGFIIMQHPIQRDLVRCPVTDDVCLQSYERLGYIRSKNLSRFTAQDELDTAGTYPTNTAGQWRENNSIPRW